MRYARLKIAAAFTAAIVTGGAAGGYAFTQLAGTEARQAVVSATQRVPGAMRPEESRAAPALRALVERIHNGTDNGDGWLAPRQERRCGRPSSTSFEASQQRARTYDA